MSQQQRTNIAPEIFQSFLDSAANAGAKGQGQFFTPIEFGELVARPLPALRPVIVDFQCGAGHLLQASAQRNGPHGTNTRHLLGADIDPCRGAKAAVLPINRIVADCTRLFPMMVDVDFQFDLGVFNPPYDLHWYREPLAALAQSGLPAVRDAFEAHDGRTGRDTIDSTVATILMALDRQTPSGEAVLIANESTLQRLIFAPGAPHRALEQHIWAHLSLDGNPMTSLQDHAFSEDASYKTGVIYFARGHHAGPKYVQHCRNLEWFTAAIIELKTNDWRYRQGSRIRTETALCETTLSDWQAVKEEAAARAKPARTDFNLWIENGVIRTNLSLFDQKSSRILKTQAQQLHDLNGYRPIQLVMQKAQRLILLSAAGLGPDGAAGTPWRVQPALQEAVQNAVREYHACRAPLYPLPKIQRLGYLDEEDFITCEKDLIRDGRTLFRKGKQYCLSSETVDVTRHGFKPGLTGEMEKIEYSGQELALYIEDESGTKWCFMEERLRDPKIQVCQGSRLTTEARRARRKDQEERDAVPIDFTLQELCEHFIIPEVADVATLNPEGYVKNLRVLEAIEAVLNSPDSSPCPPPCSPCLSGEIRLRKFQREDYSRMGLAQGGILGHEQGLGKTWASYLVPLLWLGYTQRTDNAKYRLRPNQAVLEVVPIGLHEKFIREGREKFKVEVTPIRTKEDFCRLSRLEGGRRVLPPGYYLASYEQLGVNGVAKIPVPAKFAPAEYIKLFGFTMEDVSKAYLRGEIAFEEEYLKRIGKRAARSFETLDPEDQRTMLLHFCKLIYERYTENIGAWGRDIEPNPDHKQARYNARCVYSPSLSDLAGDSFQAVAIDEGVRVKGGEDTLIGTGVLGVHAQYRLILTGTPIKNRVPDLFGLAYYVCGSPENGNPRFPYGRLDRQLFAETFCVSERNMTEKAKAGDNGKKKKRFNKLTPQVCNVHRIWKLLAPFLLRRRKKDIGEDIVRKLRRVYRVPLGTRQAERYKTVLDMEITDCHGKPAPGAKLQALRMVAAEPEIEGCLTPKGALTLTLIEQALLRHEQVIIFSPFVDPLTILSKRLTQARVRHVVCHGGISPKQRGELAYAFERGEIPVMLACIESMSEGYNFPLCCNSVQFSYPWALDKALQAEDRPYRLNSIKDLNACRLVADGSIDRKMEDQMQEKDNASEFVLDGALISADPAESNMAELLRIAANEFDPNSKTINEAAIEGEWHAMKQRLRIAMEEWNFEWAINRMATPAPEPKPRLTTEHTESHRGKREEKKATVVEWTPPTAAATPTHPITDPSPLPQPALRGWRLRFLNHRNKIAA